MELRSQLTSDDFWDNDKVQSVYIAEVKEALKRDLGEKYVHVLDYAVGSPPPISTVHVSERLFSLPLSR